MPNHPNESSTQLSLEKNLKTENKQSQTEFSHLPNEILVKIFEYLFAPEIGKLRHVSRRFNQVITSQYHGPCSSDFNNYLNLFTDNKENTVLTYYAFYEKVQMYKLEKQFLEIKTIQQNLTSHPKWHNVSPELKEAILKIKENGLNYTKASRKEALLQRDALLDAIHVEIIKSKIYLQLWHLDLDNLNLTRLPKTLFTDNELQEYWQALKLLSLADNQLTTLPAGIGGLQRLEWLSLSNNKLTSLPDEIGGLQVLIFLYIENNRLTSLPAEIAELQALKSLDINYNHLTPEIVRPLGQRFGEDFVRQTLETQTYPNIAQAEELSNRDSFRP